MKAEDLLDTLQERMKNRFTETYDDDFLLAELNSAISKVASKRWVSIDKLEDVYQNAVIDITLYNLALIGGDFESSHSENSISRTFISEQEVLKQVTPKARAL